jgi:hypothetical protein
MTENSLHKANGNKKKKGIQVLNNLETLNVSVCYFKNSAQAISHSKKAGLIS